MLLLSSASSSFCATQANNIRSLQTCVTPLLETVLVFVRRCVLNGAFSFLSDSIFIFKPPVSFGIASWDSWAY